MKKYKYLIGIMIPTRKRTKLLKECLDSIIAKTQDKSLVEILIRTDNDDPETLELCKLYDDAPIEIKILTGDRKNGYGSLHEYYNSLAKISESEFLMVFNDDVEMLTEGWEQYYKQFSEKNYIIGLRNFIYPNGKEQEIFVGYNGNPAIPHDFYNEFGSLSHHPMLDDWWVNVSNALGKKLEKWVDVKVWFKRPGGDYAHSEADTTFLEGRAHINWSHHGSYELNTYINNLRKYIELNPKKF